MVLPPWRVLLVEVTVAGTLICLTGSLFGLASCEVAIDAIVGPGDGLCG